MKGWSSNAGEDEQPGVMRSAFEDKDADCKEPGNSALLETRDSQPERVQGSPSILRPQFLLDLDQAEEAERNLASGTNLQGIDSHVEPPSSPLDNLR